MVFSTNVKCSHCQNDIFRMDEGETEIVCLKCCTTIETRKHPDE